MNTLQDLCAGRLAGARHVRLACGLTEFPRALFDLADTLEVLDLSGNALSSLPDDLHRLHRLRILFCSDNPFTELPEVLGRCPQLSMVGFKANRIRRVPAGALPPSLRWLILTDNEIEALPPEIGHCTRLQKLALAGNRLTALPDAMARCTRLELVRISANRLTALPPWLLALPRLSWLAYAGNPFCEAQESATLADLPMPAIAWQDLRLAQQLGEGASGRIYQAALGGPAAPQAVAVKLFKGAVTSDGLPRSEMAASLAAGAHPNLIAVRGKLHGHPEQTPGLVMALVPPHYQRLADPPSLQSCTRDIYPPEWRLPLGSALAIARGVASATAHLHRRGLMHGDLYAHNLLHDGHGDVRLGDFGAASFLPAGEPAQARTLQALEVRAFGCLLEELLDRCPAEAGTAAWQTLARLRDACLSEEVRRRPEFDAIAAQLEALAAPPPHEQDPAVRVAPAVCSAAQG